MQDSAMFVHGLEYAKYQRQPSRGKLAAVATTNMWHATTCADSAN